MSYRFTTGSVNRGDIYYEDDAGKNTYLDWAEDQLDIVVGAKSMIKMVEASTDKITINNGGSDVDLQIKSNNNANLIRTDGGNDRVGIGINAPASTFEVSGSIARNIKVITGETNAIGETHNTVLMGDGSGDTAVQLPAAATCKGRIYTFKRMNSGEVNCRVTPDGEEVIEAQEGSQSLDTQYNILTIQSDGSTWWILNIVHMGEG